MNDIVRAPWTSEQVQALNTAQEHGTRPPRICGAEVHASGRSPLLDATHTGWICPDPACTYTSDWEWRDALAYAAGIWDVARTASGQQPETARVGRCPVMFQGGGRCEKNEGHRPPGSDDPHTPEPASAVGQPAEAQAADRARVRWGVESSYPNGGTCSLPAVDDRTSAEKYLKAARESSPEAAHRLMRETTTWTVEDER